MRPQALARWLFSLCWGLVPAAAQVDLTGVWVAQYHEDQPERIPPELGDYLGLPNNASARLRADNWDADLLTLPEYQCRPHPSDYGDRHSHVRIWTETDTARQQVVAYRKESYIRRKGVPRSEKAIVTGHSLRHGNYLTMATIVNDPVYLTELFIRSSDYLFDPSHAIPPYPCEAVVEVHRPAGSVPHHLPGTNKYVGEFAVKHGVPPEAARGGAETMYPEYRLKMNQSNAAVRATAQK